MAKNTIILHLDWKVFLDVLSDEDLGQWTRAIMSFMETGEPPEEMSKAVEVAFYASFERIGRDLKSWESSRASKSESGRKGGIKSGEVRKAMAEQRRNEASKQNEAERSKTNLPVSCNLYPVPVSSSFEEDGCACGTETMTTILETYQECFRQPTPVIQRRLAQYVNDLGAELVCRVIKQCAECGANGWSYVATSLEDCRAKGMDLAAYEAEQVRRRAGHNQRVDRPQHSGNDILQRAVHRPLRLKREE